MRNLQKAEVLIDEEIMLLEKRIDSLREIKLALNSELLSDNSQEMLLDKVAVPSKKSNGHSHYDINANYPIDGTERAKVRFIMDKFNRPLSEQEFAEVIKQHEGPVSESLSKLARTLRGMIHPDTGDWTCFWYVPNKSLKFYIKPEWITEDKKGLKPGIHPSVEATKLLGPDGTNPALIKIKPSK